MPVDTRTIGQYENRAILLADDLFLLQSSDGEYFNATTQQIANEIPGLVNIPLSDIIIDVDKDWDAKRITNVGDPIDPQDVVTRAYGDANYLGSEFFGPWTNTHDAGVSNLVNLSNIVFSETAGVPLATDVAIYRQSDTLTLNVDEFREIKFTFKDSLKYAFTDLIADFQGNALNNAPHNHENLLGGNQLNALNALDATGTKDSTTFLRGDNTWNVPVDVEISTWTVPHDADGNNFLLSGGLIQFDNVNTKILQSGDNLHFNVADGGAFSYIIDTATKFSVSATKTNIHGNILDLNGGHIQFTNNLVRIIQSGGDLQFNVDTGNSFVFQIFNFPEFTITQTNINAHDKKIINVTDPTNAQDVVTKAFGDANYLSSINSLNDLSDVTITTVQDNDLLEFDSTGSQWKNRQGVFTGITGLGTQTQALRIGSGNNIILSNSQSITWVTTTREIFATTGFGMGFALPTGEDYKFRINNNVEYTFSGTEFIIGDANNIVLGTTTGTKIGTTSAQKISFWNATPDVQPAHIVDADGSLADITTKFNVLLQQLADMGLQASV